jgi:hypothetical protein
LFWSSCSSIFSFLCSDCRSLYVLFSLVIVLVNLYNCFDFYSSLLLN